MTYGVYSVKDELTSKFLQPMFIPTEAEALRLFKHMINTNPLWKSNPAHFSLYSIAEFDDEAGISWKENKMIQGGTSMLERTEDD